MNFQHAQNASASNSSRLAAGHVIHGKRDASVSKLDRMAATNQLFTSLNLGTNGEDLTATGKRSGGRYLGQSSTLKNYCPQRAAELVYLQLLADLQLANLDKSTAFRDKFASEFAAVCPNEQHRWMSFFVRCQARLGLKVDRDFNVVCLAAASAKTKTARSKSC